MEPWKERIIEEYTQLEERFKKLDDMLVKIDAGTLDFTPVCPVDLLREQFYAMSNYLRILRIRAEIEGIEL